VEKFCPVCVSECDAAAATCPTCGGQLVRTNPNDLTGYLLDRKYRIVGTIAQGGMGVVYRARQVFLDREVALKVLRSDLPKESNAAKRFLIEARASSMLRNPHTVTVHDFGIAEGRLYFAMELLEGEPLDVVISKGTLDWSRVVSIAVQVCSSLAEAHRHRVCHRDIKPANIFLARGVGGADFVKVLDFGIARLGEEATGLTLPGGLCGTPDYTSPEQAMGGQADARSDLYALGVVMYEMLCGRRPFLGVGPKVLMAHVRDKPLPVDQVNLAVQVPKALADAVMWVLEKLPSKRPQTAGELAEALIAAARAHGVTIEEPAMAVGDHEPGPSVHQRSAPGTAAGVIVLPDEDAQEQEAPLPESEIERMIRREGERSGSGRTRLPTRVLRRRVALQMLGAVALGACVAGLLVWIMDPGRASDTHAGADAGTAAAEAQEAPPQPGGAASAAGSGVVPRADAQRPGAAAGAAGSGGVPRADAQRPGAAAGAAGSAGGPGADVQGPGAVAHAAPASATGSAPATAVAPLRRTQLFRTAWERMSGSAQAVAAGTIFSVERLSAAGAEILAQEAAPVVQPDTEPLSGQHPVNSQDPHGKASREKKGGTAHAKSAGSSEVVSAPGTGNVAGSAAEAKGSVRPAGDEYGKVGPSGKPGAEGAQTGGTSPGSTGTTQGGAEDEYGTIPRK